MMCREHIPYCQLLVGKLVLGVREIADKERQRMTIEEIFTRWLMKVEKVSVSVHLTLNVHACCIKADSLRTVTSCGSLDNTEFRLGPLDDECNMV